MTKKPPPTRAKPASASTRRVARVAKGPATRSRLRVAKPPLVAPAASRAPELLARLTSSYPHSRCSLDFRTPFQLLVATILSAQCTDVRVNMVTPGLFARFPDAAAMAEAEREELESLIKSTGFFRNKAKSLIGMSRALVERHGGDVPSSMEELTRLPGVGRKTANVILGNAFGMSEGVVVDTHVARLSMRLGLTTDTDPVKIETALMPLFPRDRWTALAHLLIDHGRAVCEARIPRCGACVLADLCPKIGVKARA